MDLTIIIVNSTVKVFILVIFIYTLLRFFLGLYHPVVALLGKAFNPLLSPIQKLVPPLGGLDFSPMILMILIQVLGAIIVSVLRNFR